MIRLMRHHCGRKSIHSFVHVRGSRDDKKVIFSMEKVNKETPTGKQILKDGKEMNVARFMLLLGRLFINTTYDLLGNLHIHLQT